jgi:hypothetical protein
MPAHEMPLQLEHGQAGEHAEHRRHVQQLLGSDGAGDGQREQRADEPAAVFHLGVVAARRWRSGRQREVHDRRWHQPVGQRGHEDREEVEEFQLPACQTISVVMSPKALQAPPALAATTRLMQARLTKRALPAPDREHHAGHDQRGGQVVEHRRQEESEVPVSQNSWRKLKRG